uniref:Uncharacterized protein n=1 Tax=Rhipicephalus zambeziensis TaxID=60191 RepID=A0A224YA53_9ACAR
MSSVGLLGTLGVRWRWSLRWCTGIGLVKGRRGCRHIHGTRVGRVVVGRVLRCLGCLGHGCCRLIGPGGLCGSGSRVSGHVETRCRCGTTRWRHGTVGVARGCSRRVAARVVLGGTIDTRVWGRHVAHENRVGWRGVRKHVVGNVEAVVDPLAGRVRRRRGAVVGARRGEVRRGSHASCMLGRRLSRFHHGLAKLDRTSLHELQLEGALARPVAILLGLDGALDVVGTEDGLLQAQVAHGEERKAERLQEVLAVAVGEHHPVCGEVDASFLGAMELMCIGTLEGQLHSVTVKQNELAFEDENAARRMSSVQRHGDASQYSPIALLPRHSLSVDSRARLLSAESQHG